MSTMKNKEGN